MHAFPDIDYGFPHAIRAVRPRPAARPAFPAATRVRVAPDHTPEEWIADRAGGAFELLVEAQGRHQPDAPRPAG